MRTEYIRELNNNYLVIVDENERVDYQLRMITDNEPSCFLRAFFRRQDRDVKVYYDITSLQPLTRVYERNRMTGEEIQTFLDQLRQACEQAQEYLLDLNRISLSPQDIYLNLDERKLRFVFGFADPTGNPASFEERLKELFRFFLDHISAMDYAGLGLAYGLYQKCEKNGSWQEILQFAEEERAFREEKEASRKGPERRGESFSEPSNERTNPEEASAKDRSFAEEEKKLWNDIVSRWSDFYPVLAIAFCAAGLFAYLMCFAWHRSKGMSLVLAGVVFIAISVAGCLLRGLLSFGRRLLVLREGHGRKDHRRIKEKETATAADNEPEMVYGKQILSAEEEPEEYTTEPPVFRTERLVPTKESVSVYRLQSQVPAKYGDIRLTHFPFIVGTMPQNVDYVAESRAVSRMHAKFEQVEDSSSIGEACTQIWITDLNSSNGTWIEDTRLAPHQKKQLTVGEQVTLADQRYQLVAVRE